MTTGDIQEASEGQGTKVIQVTNVAKSATYDQLKTFFEFLGEIEELKVFPSQDLTSYGSKVCYVKYQDESSVHVAQHLTNTVFIDRALIVVPLGDGIIPEEHLALLMVTPATAVVGNYAAGLFPITQGVPGIIQTVIGSVMPIVRMQLTIPQPPALSNVDPAKLDEIRRTVHIRQLPKDITAEQLMSFFSACGDIQYVRIAGNEEEPTGYAFIEFNEAICVSRALQYNGALFGGVPLKVGFSKHAIVKPETEIARTKGVMDKTMRKVTEATKLVSEELDDDKSKSRKSSRSRSPSRGKRSRSPSPSKTKKRSRSRDRNYRARRRSPSRERYRGARPRMSKSRSRDRKRRRSNSRGLSKDIPRRRSKDRSRDRGKEKPKDGSKKKSEKKEEPKSPEKKKKDEDEKKRSEKEEVDEEKKEEGKETYKKKSEKTRSQSRSRSRSRQREKKREKSVSRSASRSPRQSSSKHKKRKDRRDKGSNRRASDDEFEGKKQGKGSGEEERQKPNRTDGSDDDRKKVQRRRSDGDGAGSEAEDNKKKKRNYKKKPISADHYDSESN